MPNHLLCCDWGTSSFRLRLVNTEDCSVVAEFRSSDGVAGTYQSWKESPGSDRFDFYASKLRKAITGLSVTGGSSTVDIPVLVSGMASSSIGMEEVPYAALPFAIDGSQTSAKTFAGFNGPAAPLVLVSGVKSATDVMRGEEAQLIGLAALPETSALLGKESAFVFPGTHSKHIFVKDGNMSTFRTYMTGEIFNIVSEHSILKDSITKNSDLSDTGNIISFIRGVELSDSSNLLNSLFSVRTNQLFSKLSKEENAFYLSGLLIGTELNELVNERTDRILICSGSHLYNHYKIASEALNLKNIIFIQPDLNDTATIAGQIQIFKALIQ